MRSRQYPLGFPWLSGRSLQRASAGTALALFALRIIHAVIFAQAQGHCTCGLLEHPEDLGATSKGVPASIWQLKEARRCDRPDTDFFCCALFQCIFDAPYAKPTRLLTDMDSLLEWAWLGWPAFDTNDAYKGPLPGRCGHVHSQKLVARDGSAKTL